ncbi:MAG TPA: VOC family protein [Thermoanaerobaculia bacterium]|jgi:catechol 2,3-dioxygenase-like lactoylglutathione lyase family enzyme|nr:VOC family protein [Thermoanaerobaculia bacterium]
MNVPDVDFEQHHASLAMSDIPAALDFYTTKLGFRLAITWGDPPNFAGVNLGGNVQIFLRQGTPDPNGSVVFFIVDAVDDLYEFHSANGADTAEAPSDKPWHIRDYTVRDLDGNYLVFGQRLHETEPRLKIERVDVPVRLETRIAALLTDLAAHKRMSLTSCLEEILLHTCEPLGDGVASPHTKSDLAYIQKLKAKHGIDYDSHASYRFVEE